MSTNIFMCNWRFIRKFEETFFLPALSSKGKQTTLQFSTVSKKPKKNPWSDEESEAGSDEESPVAPREHVNRPTKGETALGLETAIFNGFEKKPHFFPRSLEQVLPVASNYTDFHFP